MQTNILLKHNYKWKFYCSRYQFLVFEEWANFVLFLRDPKVHVYIKSLSSCTRYRYNVNPIFQVEPERFEKSGFHSITIKPSHLEHLELAGYLDKCHLTFFLCGTITLEYHVHFSSHVFMSLLSAFSTRSSNIAHMYFFTLVITHAQSGSVYIFIYLF